MVKGVVVCAVQENVCCQLPHEHRLELGLPVQSEQNLCSRLCKHTRIHSITLISISFFQVAFAEHQKKMAALHGISEKCTGVKKMEWTDSLRGELFSHQK